MKNILCEIKIIFCECSSDIIILVSSALNKFLIFRNDYIITALSVRSHSHTVIDFFSSVKRQNSIIHFTVDIFDLVIIKKKSVCCNCKAKMLVVFLFDASCVFNRLLYNIKIHKRLTAEEIHLKIPSCTRIGYYEVDSLFRSFKRHKAAALSEIALCCKAVFAAEVTVV